MAVSKKPYSLDEYYKDKYGGQMAVSPLNRTVSRSPGSVRPVSAVHAGAMQRRQQFLRSMNVTEKSKQTTEQTQTTPDTAGGIDTTSLDNLSPEGGALTEKEFNSKLTTADTMSMLEDALASLAEWGNRKFVYNAKESPLYTILQQQAEKEARLASGRAYSRAVANTGGFGSSYATLAAEEAGRQVMEGLDDQQLALYQAAREEFDAERQSALDWYNTAKQLHSDRMALDELQATEATGVTEGAKKATDYLRNTYGLEYFESTMQQDLLSHGYSETDVAKALNMQRAIAKATITDYKASDITSAVEKADMINEAYKQGILTVEEYDEAKTQNSAIIFDNVSKGMTRIDDVDHAALGISDEEWNGKNDNEKKLAVFDRVGELTKDGVVSSRDFYKLLYNDIKEEFASEEFKTSKNQIAHAVAVADLIEEYHDSGYLSDDEYKDFIYKQIVPQISGTRFWKVLNLQDEAIGGDKEYKWYSNPFNALENYDAANSYGSPAIAKISRGLSHDEKKLILKYARETRKE